MKKHAGNLISWGSVWVVIFFIYTQNPILIAISIFVAAIMDMFDGKLARLYGDNTKEAKVFGELTDSLCDTFNFGITPGLILPFILFNDKLSIVTMICAMFFIWAGTYRLARFSATKSDGIVDYYTGVPITVAGPILGLITVISNSILIFAIASLILGYLMVSNLQVKKLKI